MGPVRCTQEPAIVFVSGRFMGGCYLYYLVYFLKKNYLLLFFKFIFSFGCVGSSLLHAGFL